MWLVDFDRIFVGCLYPFRQAVTDRPRGALLRLASVQILKLARRAGLRPTGALIRPLDQHSLVFKNCDSTIVDNVFWFGTCGYEGVMARCWTFLCSKSCRILEVGANIGFYTIIGGATAPEADYLSVEANPSVFSILTENIALNALRNVTAANVAAIPDSEPKTVELDIPSEQRGMPVGARLSVGVEGAKYHGYRRIEVAGVPMAELARGRDLIKIDAEGIEAALLQSIIGVIAASAPTLVVEVLPESRNLVALIRDLCLRVGYDCYIVPSYRTDALWKISGSTLDVRMMPFHHSKDLILTHTDLSSAFAITNRGH